MDQIEAALIIEKQALESLTYKVNDFLKHPIRLIQASKSLIGLSSSYFYYTRYYQGWLISLTLFI